MILRLLEYLARIYQNQMEEYGTLFPVVPLVIYNGEEKWREPQCLSKSFSYITRELSKYIPDFMYILIDERRFSDALLKRLKNAVAYFFLLDKTNLRKRGSAEDRIIMILQELKQRDIELFDLLGRYIAGLMEYRGVETTGINDYSNTRGKPMLAQSLDKLIEESMQKGKEEGIERGIEQGIEEGIEQGIERKAHEDARKMLDKGYRIEDIYDITGLSKEEVEKLK